MLLYKFIIFENLIYQKMLMGMYRDNIVDDDTELIRLIKESDTKSFEKIFLKYYSRFYRFILGFVKDEWIAEDISQNVFLKVWEHRFTLDESKSMTAYLYVLAKYEIYNHFRSKRNRCTERLSNLIYENIASYPNVEEEYNLTQLHEIIKKTIAVMPEKRREIFNMSRYEFLSAKQIAERTGLSVRTVEKHIELALRDIRSKVSPFLFLLFLLFDFAR